MILKIRKYVDALFIKSSQKHRITFRIDLKLNWCFTDGVIAKQPSFFFILWHTSEHTIKRRPFKIDASSSVMYVLCLHIVVDFYQSNVFQFDNKSCVRNLSWNNQYVFLVMTILILLSRLEKLKINFARIFSVYAYRNHDGFLVIIF